MVISLIGGLSCEVAGTKQQLSELYVRLGLCSSKQQNVVHQVSGRGTGLV